MDRKTLQPIFSREFDLESIKAIFEKNHCKFNNEFYKQISRKTMDTTFASKYAILTMGYFEVHLDDVCAVEWGKEFKEFFIENCILRRLQNSTRRQRKGTTTGTIVNH